MAVSVNLQEVFPSDSQGNLTAKLNFNFNQLLALGLGLKGDKGDKGDTGPIGPIGLTGAIGPRGTITFAVQDTSAPTDSANTTLLANSVNGDIFINSTKLFVKGAVSTGVWSQVVDFAGIVNSQSLQDPYKVLQLGMGVGSTASKHSVLLRTKGLDSNNTALASSHPQYYTGTVPDNTQLVLTNFDETKTYRIDGNTLVANTSTNDATFEYTALQKIVAYLPSTLIDYRHQFELGSVDGDQVTVNGTSQYYVLTPTEQNLKFRKYRVTNASVTGGLYNRAELDLSGANASANSMNGETALIINKREVISSTQVVSKVELGLSNSNVLVAKYPAAGLNLDGLYIVKGSFQAGMGLKADDSTTMLIKANVANVRVNDIVMNTATAGSTISHTDPTSKWISLGSAIRVQNSKVVTGIPFPATAVLQSDSNNLDDYREGTWTPAVNLSATIQNGTDFSSSGWSVTAASGKYVKVGQVVHYVFEISVKAASTATSFTSALSLGFTSATSVNVGTEAPSIRITGFPNWSPLDNMYNHCDIDLYATSVNLPTLREVDVTTSIGGTSYTLYPMVPRTLFGRAVCLNFGTTLNPSYSQGIELYGHKYLANGRTNSVRSRLTPYDFLMTSSSAQFVRIVGSGYYFTNMGVCTDPNVQQGNNNALGGGA